jgi:hypothetical protein
MTFMTHMTGPPGGGTLALTLAVTLLSGLGARSQHYAYRVGSKSVSKVP